MDLPNLSNLDILAPENGVTLFEHLAEKNAGYLKGCKKHYDDKVEEPKRPRLPKKPIQPKRPSSNTTMERMARYEEHEKKYRQKDRKYMDDMVIYNQRMAQYKRDIASNCANHGYYMYKQVKGAETDPEDYLGETITLPSDNPDQPIKLLPLDREDTSEEKAMLFEKAHPEWIKNTWNTVCQETVFWKIDGKYQYALELMKYADWYYIDDDQKRGHLFVTLVDDDFKDMYGTPNSGVFQGNYLFIQLVCATTEAKGFGRKMLGYAEELSKKLGCNGIAMASLATPAGVYYRTGYRFVTSDGLKINTDAWTREVVEDGNVKVFLLPYKKVDTADDKRYREDQGNEEDEAKEEDEIENNTKRSRLADLFSFFF
tara:strand:- start:783 stop:1895 length:1113 start_codon:yes stop_codon:yes gene_type:complete